MEFEKFSAYQKAILENIQDHQNDSPELFELIQETDSFFHEEVFIDNIELNITSQLLCFNSYTLLLSGINLSLGGHVSSVFPVIRTALESACYAYLVSQSDILKKIWLNREKSKSSLDKCRKRMSVKDAANKIHKEDKNMSEYVIELYANLISHGAHPNVKSISSHLNEIDHIDKSLIAYNFTCIYNKNSIEINRALLSCVEVAHAIAYLIVISHKTHPLKHEKRPALNRWINNKNDFFKTSKSRYEI